MKVLSLVSIALFASVAMANNGGGYKGCGGRCGGRGRYDDDHHGGSHRSSSAAEVGGNNNEGRVNGLLNNLLKGGILSDNSKNADTTVVQDPDY